MPRDEQMAFEDIGQDAWFAGFMAGEGCFDLKLSQDGGIVPRAAIELRADDLLVLQEVQRSFGGAITVYKHAHPSCPNPNAAWAVVGKRDLAGLVAYFDAFPLRAKKARDYAIWRLAVKAYCASGRHAPELVTLRDALSQTRPFDGSFDGSVTLPETPQLKLVDHAS